MKTMTIKVVNPSGYARSDYVEVELVTDWEYASHSHAGETVVGTAADDGDAANPLVVPPDLDESNLRLMRIERNRSETEIPFQIDRVLGSGSPKRILSFLSENTPPGDPDYRCPDPSATFRLEEGRPRDFRANTAPSPLKIDHYYEVPEGDEPSDGFSPLWHGSRRAHTVKLHNGRLELAIRLSPVPAVARSSDLTGAVSSIGFYDAPGRGPLQPDNMLSPFGGSPEKRWGQLTKLAFFPLPWELQWFHEFDLLGHRYELLWSHAGPVRSVITLRSEPMTIHYRGSPLFRPGAVGRPAPARAGEHALAPDEVEVQCRLYRVLSVHPYKPFYTEDLFVLADRLAGQTEDVSISFRPYFHSVLDHYDFASTKLARFEHIPDYFALWKQLGELHYGYGFASDAHVRALTIEGNQLWWRLPTSHHNRCIHYFMFRGCDTRYDPYHEIGHDAWYEHVLKPLEAVPLARRYPAPVPEEGGIAA